MITNYYKYAIVSSFIMMCLVSFGLLILYIKPQIGDGQKIYRIRFVSVDKIIKGTYVNFAGNPVGSVVKITKLHNKPDNIQATSDGLIYTHEVTVKVDSSIKIHQQDKVYSSTVGLLGERIITIVPVNVFDAILNPEIPNQGIILAQTEDAITDIFKQVSCLAAKTGHTLENIDSVVIDNKEAIKTTLIHLSTLLSIINKFFHNTDKHNLIHSADLIVTYLESVLAQFQVALENIANSKNLDNISNIIENVSRMSDVIKHLNDSNITQNAGIIIANLADTIQYINNVIATIQSLINSSDENSYSFIKEIINNPALYKESVMLIKEIRSLIYDINRYGVVFYQNRAWQHERLPSLSPPV